MNPDTAPWMIPGVIQLDSSQVEPIGPLDATAQLNAGQTITNPVATLLDEQTGQFVPASLIGNPIISGNTLTQTVGNLTAGHRYRLLIDYSPSPPATVDGQINVIGAVIACPS